MSEETTKRVNCHENGNLLLFCIEKDTRSGVLYAPFACVLMVEIRGFEPLTYALRARNEVTPLSVFAVQIAY